MVDPRQPSGRPLTEADIPLVVADPNRLMFLSDSVPLTPASTLFASEQVEAMLKAIEKRIAIYRTDEVVAVYRPTVGPHGFVAIAVGGTDVCYPLGIAGEAQ